jgi:hypothetical protein
MAGRRERPYHLDMKSLGPLVTAVVVFLAFTGFSLWVVATRGYLGFLTLAGDDRWALQMLIDLVIACSFAIAWMIGDARKRGINPWPYVAAVVPLGSVGVLAYMIRRALSR